MLGKYVTGKYLHCNGRWMVVKRIALKVMHSKM